MLYIFHGPSYNKTYQKGIEFAEKLSSKYVVVNNSVVSYTKESIDEYLHYFKLSSEKNKHQVLLIENPEKIKEDILKNITTISDRLENKHILIYTTNCIHKIKKTILSRAITFYINEIEEDLQKYNLFIDELIQENFLSSSIEDLLNKYLVNEENTLKISENLLFKFPSYQDKILLIQKQYLSFIKNEYITYWKLIYFLLKK